ncbi:MAG: NAD(P)H-binding protein [Stigonema ocellatum SAG 48.90 = DSM 106950]|nr:NAD(P)H-binding protein [Stigonema ocellatum SAG 48.90 = DSM 106950]
MTTSNPVALILGATGRTGSHLVNLLELDGGPDDIEIRVAVRKPEQAGTFAKRGIATVHLDLDDLSTYEKAPPYEFITTTHSPSHTVICNV